MERIVILAGRGALPRAVADSIASRGGKVHIIAIDGAAAAEFGPHATTRVGLGKIGAIVELAQRTGDKLVIIGHLTRPDLWKLKPDLGFLRHLRALGEARAEAFLDAHFEAIGERSSTDVLAKFL